MKEYFDEGVLTYRGVVYERIVDVGLRHRAHYQSPDGGE